MKPPIIGQSNTNVSQSAGVLVAMATVVAGFFIVIKVGFVIHGQPEPPPFDNPAITFAAVLVLVAVLGFVLFKLVEYVRWHGIRAQIRTESRRSQSEHMEARRLRVAELSVDPRRAKYAPLVERGEDWPNEHIDYAEDFEMTALCTHLAPIEREMRRSGIDVRRYREHDVTAKCRIDPPTLRSHFSVAPPIRYEEVEQGERASSDFLFAFLICDEHNCMLYTVHPDEGGAGSLPIFPALPTV
jgi:hypothetical protein